MIESLPRNGSCIQRKKVFVQYPFHSLNHSSPFQWPEDRSSQQKLRIKNRSSFEQEYIRRLYNDKMQRKLNQKFNAPSESFKKYHNQISDKRGQEALNEEIDHFNQSKVFQNNGPKSVENINQNKQPLQRNYQSAKQINTKPSIDHFYHSPHLYSNKGNINGPIYPNHEGNRFQNSAQKEQEVYQFQEPISPNYVKRRPEAYKQENTDSYKRYYINKGNGHENLQNYPNLNNSTNLQNPNYRLRNYIPDQLEGYLRQNVRLQRKRVADNTLSRQTNPNI